MLSFSKALKFIFQPTTFLLAFIWMFIYATGLTVYMKSLLNTLLSGNFFQLFGILGRWIQIYATVLWLGCFLTFMYILIVAKKHVFENPPNFSFSFFIRKSLILLPVIMGYGFLGRIGLRFLQTYGTGGKIGMGCALVALSYLFWNFIVAFLEHFNFSSVRRLILSALKKPYLILQFWGYTILTGLLLRFAIRYLVMGLRLFLKELLPALLPCGAGIGVLVTFIFIFIAKMLFDALNRTGRIFLIASFIFIVPSLFLLHIIPLPINTLVFLITMQIFWYVNYLSFVLYIGALAFLCNLLAQITRKISKASNPQPLPGSDIHVQNLL